MASYTWSIVNLKRTNNSDKGVTNIHYKVMLQDGNNSVATELNMRVVPNPDSEDFIAFESLTESDVVGWVKAQLGENGVSDLERMLTEALARKLQPETVSEIPWS